MRSKNGLKSEVIKKCDVFFNFLDAMSLTRPLVLQQATKKVLQPAVRHTTAQTQEGMPLPNNTNVKASIHSTSTRRFLLLKIGLRMRGYHIHMGRYQRKFEIRRWKNTAHQRHCRSFSTASNSNEESSGRIRTRQQATMKWLDSIVIGQKLCPFAPPVRMEPQLRIKISDASTYDDIIRDVETEAHLLVGGPAVSQNDKIYTENDNLTSQSLPPSLQQRPETALIVLDEDACPVLHDFRELVRLSWRVQEEAINQHGYTQLVQQVLFHPHASHNTYGISADGEEDAADYTIRSPFPTIHLLREVDVMKAVTSGYKDLESLPSRNKARMRKDGAEHCARRLEACKKVEIF